MLGVAGIFQPGATIERIARFFRDLAQRTARQARLALSRVPICGRAWGVHRGGPRRPWRMR